MFDQQSYLKRTSYSSNLTPTAETLRKIHVAHMQSVPFENLDIHFGRSIELSTNAFFRKIVQQNRGGFCYELNGLFAELLKSIGYSVTLLSGRVARADGGFGPDFDHMTLLLDLDERWIADVGFGDSFVEPLLLDKTEEQIQNGKRYRILPQGSAFLYQSFDNDAWTNQYIFELTPHALKDYQEMCLYHQTSPDSPFTQKVVCSKATPEGRITLTDKKWIVTSGNERTEINLSGREHFHSLLMEHFGIALNENR